MKNEKVLLVEDTPNIVKIVRAVIGDDCELSSAASIAEAREALRLSKFSLILLDIGLPDGSGLEFCLSLRAQSELAEIPIFFLTAESAIAKKVMGFNLGADDYITKPFDPEEFRARVLGRLKRKTLPANLTAFSCGSFHIDLTVQKTWMFLKDGTKKELILTPMEFKLLVQFLRNEGTVFSREELLAAVWGSAVHVSGHTVDTHMSSLRKKIGECALNFRTILKKGYCYNSSES